MLSIRQKDSISIDLETWHQFGGSSIKVVEHDGKVLLVQGGKTGTVDEEERTVLLDEVRPFVVILKSHWPKLTKFDVAVKTTKSGKTVGIIDKPKVSEQLITMAQEYAILSGELNQIEKRKETLRTMILHELDQKFLGEGEPGILVVEEGHFIERTVQKRREIDAAAMLAQFGGKALAGVASVKIGEWNKFKEINDIDDSVEEQLTLRINLVNVLSVKGY